LQNEGLRGEQVQAKGKRLFIECAYHALGIQIMDLLFLLKLEHDQIRTLLSLLSSEPSQDVLRERLRALEQISTRLIRIEADFLFPEVDNLFAGVDHILSNAMNNQGKISSLLSSINELLSGDGASSSEFSETLSLLLKTIESHVADQQEFLIPRIRKLIPTKDREELGQVFLEVRGEAGAGI
jgi:hemerythrin superfamily protein